MKISAFVKRLFFEGYWECRYRSVDNSVLPKASGSWTGKLKVSDRYWCADPFLVVNDGKTYAFVELMDRYHSYGLLGYAEIEDPNTDAEVKVLMDLGFHTSYPNIFQYENEWYMIPETSANHSLELYRAKRFPDKWEKVACLMSNVDVVDSTVFPINGKLMLFLYQSNGDENKLSIAELNPQKAHISNPTVCKEYNQKIGRPGGSVLKCEEGMIRPTQYGVHHYGEKLVFKQFCFEAEGENYQEKDILEISCRSFDDCQDFIGLHTYNRCEKIEIIDLYQKRFYPFRPVMLILKKLRLFGFRQI